MCKGEHKHPIAGQTGEKENPSHYVFGGREEDEGRKGAQPRTQSGFQATISEQKRDVGHKKLWRVKEELPRATELFLLALLHLTMVRGDSSVPLWCPPHELNSQHLSYYLMSPHFRDDIG